MSEKVDFEAEGLLEGLDGEARDERLRLLEYLHSDGVSLDELRSAVATGTHMFLAAERLVGGGAKYTGREIVERSGLDREFLDAVQRASGFPLHDPDERVFSEADLARAANARAFLEAGLPAEDMIEIGRILSQGMSRAAEAMRAVVLKLVLRPGVSEHELAVDYTDVVGRLMPHVGPMLTQLMNAHLRQMAQTEAINMAEMSSGQLPGARDVAIGFADLVGFTRMGEEVPADELGRVARRLEGLAGEVVSRPVQLVKTIGDAAMLASPEPDSLLDAAFELVAAADAEGPDFPQLRVGLAWGAALSRAGDWFGRPVNLADRVTAVARPGSVLATRDLRDAARGDGYNWSFAGARRLKGVREPVPLYRARPLTGDRD
jgi:adenylate cyclase